mgnify:CR=1 FL=1
MSAHARIVGLDIARSVAIIGMIILHMANLVWGVKVVLSGLPAAGFAIIAGATMMILARDYSLRVFMKLVARGCLIMLIGLALLPVGGEIQVVLVVMGAAMALTAWVPPLATGWKVLLFALATAAATFLYAPYTLPQVYPLVAFLAYMVAGMLLFDVYLNRSTRTQTVSTAVAVVVTGIGMWQRFNPEIPGWLRFTGHTGVLGEILLSVAVTAVVLHLCLVLGRQLPRVFFPFAALGSMSLTIYILHILTASYWQAHVSLHNTMAALGFVLAFLVLSALWKKFCGKGPAERAVAWAIKEVAA